MTEAIATTTGTLEHVDPNALRIELNVRTEASLTKQFVASIRENGVLVPIVAVRDADGMLTVRAGQRRTLAAREAGLTSVPVYVTDAEQDIATRVVAQITENDQRLALGSVDRVAGIQSLLDTGLSVTKVAKRLAVSAERVKASKAVAGSPVALDALVQQTATLEEAAGIAEFEDDPDAVNLLLRAAGRGYFEQELERMRQKRAHDVEFTRAVGDFTNLGYTVLTEYPRGGSGLVPLEQLFQADGSDVPVVVKDPQHWSIILSEESVFTNSDGERVAEELVDWSTEDDPEAVAQEGMVHVNAVTESTEFVPSSYFCHDPEAEGLVPSERFTKLAEASAQLPDGVQLETSEDVERKAKDKAERRKVIALNKAAEAAASVRQAFVRSLVQRKTPPKGAMLFVTQRLLSNGMLLTSHRGDEIAGELLGAEVRSGELLDHATDPRAEVILLGLTLGALESVTPKSAWRGPGQDSVAYLQFLAANGYGLSPVEQVVTGDKTAEDCVEELA